MSGEQKPLSWEEGSLPLRLESTGTVGRLTRSERSLEAISTARKVLYLGNWHMCETVETVTQKHFIKVKLTIKFLNSTAA